jgi:hypothetical protein
MPNGNNNQVSSSHIIKELIPGKNDDDYNQIVNQSNNNNQQPFIENYNEKDIAKAVIDVMEEPEKNVVEINTYKAEK